MIKVEIDEDSRIAYLEPTGSLVSSDFETIRDVVDPFIEKIGGLNGFLIHGRQFPGWDSLKEQLSELYFENDHHMQIPRIAVVTDDELEGFEESLGQHFVNAELRHFPYDEYEDAREWLKK